MKRLALSLLALVVLPWIAVSAASAAVSDCTYEPSGTVMSNLSDCVPTGSISTDDGDADIASVKDRIIQVADNLIILGSLVAIGGIIYSSFLFIFSGGDDGQATNARMGIIYSLAGFAAMLLAFPLVNAVINFVFDLE